MIEDGVTGFVVDEEEEACALSGASTNWTGARYAPALSAASPPGGWPSEYVSLYEELMRRPVHR